MDKFQIAGNIKWEDLGNGIKRQIYGFDDQIMMVKVHFKKNAIGTIHQHPHVQTTYVESGEFEFTIGGKTQRVKKGDGCYMQPDILHGCVCIEEGILIDVFSPFREDFIK